MQPAAPVARTGSRRNRVWAILTVLAVVAGGLALVWWVWYPTTLQPQVTLTNSHFVATACAPVLNGYANRFNVTFTLVNAGRADGDAGVQFLLGNFSLGYQHYFVPQGSEMNGTGAIIWEVYASPSECGPLDVPGPPAVSLASVARSPPLDERALLQATVNPLATLAFSGVMLGGLAWVARRHGLSLLQDLGATGWGAAILTVFAAGLLASVVTLAAITPYNFPLDWTPVFVYGAAYGVVGAVVFIVAARLMAQEGKRRRPPGP